MHEGGVREKVDMAKNAWKEHKGEREERLSC